MANDKIIDVVGNAAALRDSMVTYGPTAGSASARPAAETTAVPSTAQTTAAQPIAQTAVQPASTTTAAPSTTPVQLSPYDYNNRVNQINAMYDSQLNAQKNALEAAYNQNMSDLEANRAKIAQQYQTQRNANAVNYERNRRNFNQQAMMNGLNTGAGSQAALAQNASYQGSMATLGAAEANANNDLEKSIADLKSKYQSDVNAAIAKNDYNKAATLLDEYNNAYSQAMTKAQTLAQYGDFSGYSAIYGADAARQMSAAWTVQNPMMAYNLGRISANKYHQITGAWPPGYSASSGGRGGRGGGSGEEDGTGSPSYDDIPLEIGEMWDNDAASERAYWSNYYAQKQWEQNQNDPRYQLAVADQRDREEFRNAFPNTGSGSSSRSGSTSSKAKSFVNRYMDYLANNDNGFNG